MRELVTRELSVSQGEGLAGLRHRAEGALRCFGGREQY